MKTTIQGLLLAIICFALAVTLSLHAAEQNGTKPPVPPTPSNPLAEKLYSGALGFRDMLVIKRHHLTLSHVYTYHAEGFIPGGGLYVYKPTPDGGRMRELVASPEGEIIDCDLSFDGKEVLFSWKRKGRIESPLHLRTTEHCREVPEENYQVYRINIDGTGLTQLTNGKSHNLNACWLPDGGIAFISDRVPAYAYCYITSSPVLYRMERDGSKVKRLSYNYLIDITPGVMPDGRIVFTRWEYVDRPPGPIQSLWTIHPDGTGLSGLYGNRAIEPGTFMQSRPIPGTDKIICMMCGHNGDCRGAIGIIDPAKGANAQDAITNLTPEIPLGRVDDIFSPNGNLLMNRGPYETPFPIDSRHYLVSRSGVIQLRVMDASAAPLDVLNKDGELGFYSAMPVMARSKPPIIPSRLPPEAETKLEATVFIADVYRGLEPQVKRSEVRQIAVVEEIPKSTFTPIIWNVPSEHGIVQNWAFGFKFPAVSCGATWSPRKIWGYAEVAPDGSACFKVPANVPLNFQALDAQGRNLQRMRTFTHFMPGEIQGCVGCHNDRNSQAAQSRLVAQMRPQELRLPEWGAVLFSYRNIVQPVLDKHCIRCHNARSAPSDVDLSGDMTDFFNVSYDILARKGTIGELQPEVNAVPPASRKEGRSPYTSWISTLNGAEYNILMVEPKTWGAVKSKLADLIIAGHPGSDGKARVMVPPDEQRRVFAWIDLNVPYYANSRSCYPAAMGCRRLFPEALNPTLQEVAQRRCVSCHSGGIPRRFYIRVEKPELNNFLLAPLAKSAGGMETKCKPVFASRNDPDYQKILMCFEPVQRIMRDTPRADAMLEIEPKPPQSAVGKR